MIKKLTVNIAAIINPVSSIKPKFIAAEDPTIDHNTGIIKILKETFLEFISNNPKVNIVVGQGSPKVGEDGYRCP